MLFSRKVFLSQLRGPDSFATDLPQILTSAGELTTAEPLSRAPRGPQRVPSADAPGT